MSLGVERSIDATLPGQTLGAQHFEHAFGQIGNLLTPEIQAKLHDIATLVEYRHAVDAIFSEGDEVLYVYFVASGMVRKSRCSVSGRRQVITLMLPGDMFGFPDRGLYVNSAKAMGDVTLYRVGWPQLNALMQGEPLFQSSLLARMTFDLHQAQKRILALGQHNVSQRLASFLLDLMEHEEFYDARKRHLSFPLSRFDLGEYLGTSPETVVRALARLEKDGLIRRLSSRLLQISDAGNLARLLSERRRID